MSSPESLTVLQWNVWYRAKANKVADHLRAIVGEHGVPDALCLQEVTGASAEKIADVVKARDVSFVKTRRHRNGLEEGQAIIAPKGWVDPWLGVEVRPLCFGGRAPFKGGPDSCRVLQTGIVGTSTGNTYRVGNTHTSYWTPTNAEARNTESVNLSMAVSSEERFVLAGDFNASPSSPLVSKLGTYLVRAEHGQPTWTSAHADRLGFLRKEIDHVFVSQDMLVQNVQVLDPGPSDHAPILVQASARI